MSGYQASRFGLAMVALFLAAVPAWTLAQGEPDLTRLPVGDGRISTEPQQGYAWRCGGPGPTEAAGAFRQGPWFNGDGTYDLTAKLTVDGSVAWSAQHETTVDGGTRRISGNGLPSHPSGTYPVSPSDDAYAYDRNPNAIRAQTISVSVPAAPVVAERASCLTPGAIGYLLTGVAVYDPLDAGRRDAVATEIQDACQGHPQREGVYHYHSITTCIDDPEGDHSPLVGYAIDGFGIYGRRGEGGMTLRNEDLDECHGHTHTVIWDGEPREIFHYHATWEYPYTLGCFRGSPVRTGAAPGGQGPQPKPGPR